MNIEPKTGLSPEELVKKFNDRFVPGNVIKYKIEEKAAYPDKATVQVSAFLNKNGEAVVKFKEFIGDWPITEKTG